MNHRFVVIMAGGKGERFWPASRLHRPKHLLPIVGEEPMLAQTVDRIGPLVPRENVFVITNQEQHAAVLQACPSLPPENVVAEPVGRDTAPAVGLALLMVERRDPRGVFAMLPADHVIPDPDAFRAHLQAAFEAAESDDVLVTIGVQPTEPATGFGYIEKGRPWKTVGDRRVFRVNRFVEKPDRATAEAYLKSGNYLWNAGMFVWKVPVIRHAFATFAPELEDALSRLDAKRSSGADLATTLREVYPSLPKISVDYAILEKAKNIVVLPAGFDWDDVGSWPAIARHFPKDGHGNVLRGLAAVEEGSGNVVVSRPDHLTALFGVDNLVVVHTPDATLICPKDKAGEMKKLVHSLQKREDCRKLL